MNGSPLIDSCKLEERGTSIDINEHELHLDDTYPDTLCLDTLFEHETSSKALVLPSSDEYLKQLKSGEYKAKYYDLFWCTHAYHHMSKK